MMNLVVAFRPIHGLARRVKVQVAAEEHPETRDAFCQRFAQTVAGAMEAEGIRLQRADLQALLDATTAWRAGIPKAENMLIGAYPRELSFDQQTSTKGAPLHGDAYEGARPGLPVRPGAVPNPGQAAIDRWTTPRTLSEVAPPVPSGAVPGVTPAITPGGATAALVASQPVHRPQPPTPAVPMPDPPLPSSRRTASRKKRGPADAATVDDHGGFQR